MIIGIDIGTSYSSVAILKNGKAEPIKPGTESVYSVPSAVYVDSDGTLVIAQAAVSKRMIDPSRFKDNFKRDFGTNKPYLLGDRRITPDEIYMEYFKYFKQSVIDVTGEQITKAYITHPVSYSNQKKQILQQAANYAGLFDIELLDEPTAAALSYFSERSFKNSALKNGERLLVYDFGGGTFDLTLVEMSDNGLRLMTDPIGISECGGSDIDRLLYDDFVAHFSKEQGFEDALKSLKFRSILGREAVDVKHRLSADTYAIASISVGMGEFRQYTVTREHFNTLIDERVRHTCYLIEQIAKNAGITVGQIDKVLCVGGSTRIPYITMCIEETISKRAIKTADPELAVCLGAVMKEAMAQEPQENEKEQTEEQQKEEQPTANEVYKNTLVCATCGKQEQTSKECIDKYWYCESCKAEAQKTEEQNEQQERIIEAQKMADKGYSCLEQKNYADAFVLLEKAALWGESRAQCNLGFCYENGYGTDKNHTKAFEWYEKAASQGSAVAQRNLGLCYEHGRGTRQNYIKAKKWYLKAAAQGNGDAKKSLDKFRQQEEQNRIEQEQRLARERIKQQEEKKQQPTPPTPPKPTPASSKKVYVGSGVATAAIWIFSCLGAFSLFAATVTNDSDIGTAIFIGIASIVTAIVIYDRNRI